MTLDEAIEFILNRKEDIHATLMEEAKVKHHLEFFNIGGVWKLLNEKDEASIREHERQHAIHKAYSDLFR